MTSGVRAEGKAGFQGLWNLRKLSSSSRWNLGKPARKWKLSRLCFVASYASRFFSSLSSPVIFFLLFFFLFLSSPVRIYHDVSRIQQGLNEDIFVAFIGSCQNADPREQFDNRDDARKIDDLRDELQADDADQSYV